MDTWNKLKAIRGDGEDYWIKEGEGISQKTYIHNPQAQTTVW